MLPHIPNTLTTRLTCVFLPLSHRKEPAPCQGYLLHDPNDDKLLDERAVLCYLTAMQGEPRDQCK